MEIEFCVFRFFYFVKEYNIETESTIDQYYTLLDQWDCRYFVRLGYHRILIKMTEFSENSQGNIYDGVQFYVNL